MSEAAAAVVVEEETKEEVVAAIPKKKRKPRKPKTKDATKPKAKRPPSAWILHVQKTRALSPGMTYKEAMKAASKTYKKKAKAVTAASTQVAEVAV